MKSNGSGIKVWILEAIVGLTIAVILVIGAWWFADASDTLKTAATDTDIAKAIEAKTVSRSGIREMIRDHSPYVPDKAKLENAIKSIDEMKNSFTDFKKEQGERMQKFEDNQMENMKLLMQINSKLESR